MPRRRGPSFLTKQKEQQRRTRATEKREARRARKKARSAGTEVNMESGSTEAGAPESTGIGPEQEA